MSLLTVKIVPFNVPLYNDSGSGAHKDLATWKPELEEGWSYLGPAANNGNSQGSTGVVVLPASTTTRVLAPIADWEMVWSDAGSGESTDYALWRGLPSLADRLDYLVIGGFFVRSHNKPSKEAAMGMMAVHKDALIVASPGREIWNDAGMGARQNGAVWEISTDGHLQGISTGAFVPVAGYNNPPRATYALDRTKLRSHS